MGLKFYNNALINEEAVKKDLPLDDQNYTLLRYSDYLLADNNRKVQVKDLGSKFASINAFFFDYLKEYHIPISFLKTQNGSSLKFVKHVRYPFFIKILNVIDKRTAKIFGKKEGDLLNLPVFEIHYPNGKDSLVTESHLITFDVCTNEDLKLMNRICSKVNAVLKFYFERRTALLSEVICCFGKSDEKIYLVDDFTPTSLKIIPQNTDGKWVDPYNLNTSADIRKYTDFLLNMTSA
ncbi:MAG TPA: phosphoribosylaminoimidazolesuccinocarboxamide synthase [Ignavibacteriaceae bacterium]|nr:phosphoribosylaminoimidazolesuccinocarboxamide synthase [Ignavibacteriaceae bacterium]